MVVSFRVASTKGGLDEMSLKVHPSHWKKFRTMQHPSLEHFKDVPGTGGTYRVSKDGVVISNRHKGLIDDWWMVLKIHKSTNSKPFNRVSMYFDGDKKARCCQLSRVILEAWKGPAPSEMHVAAHRNGKTDDDVLGNLVWATQKEVSEGQICRGTWAHGDSAGAARSSIEQVEAARKIVMEYGVPINLLATVLDKPSIRVKEWLTKCWRPEKWDGLENPLLKSC
jgi:hypothetical protein